MAPEQVTHYREVKPAADQYSAAATLYYLLSGQYVMDFAPDTTKQMVQIITEERIPIRQRRPEVPEGLGSALQKALAREQDDRFPSVIALREAIRPFA
jgi:serine/threonine-protein kinase